MHSNPIKQARERLGMTQKTLAHHLGIARNYVYMMETGRKPITPEMLANVEKLERSIRYDLTSAAPPAVAEDQAPYGGDADYELLREVRAMRAQLDTLTALLGAVLAKSPEK